MRRMAVWLCIGFTAQASADTEVTISTDRPSVTEYSAVVPRGGLQIESGMQATNNAGQWTLDLPESFVRYGLLESTELRLVVPNYFLHLPVGGSTASGFGDLGVGLKQQLGPLAGFNVAMIPMVTFPTGARGISSGGYDPGLRTVGRFYRIC
jgi:Putative MetA-pathway of phenol degradation